MPTAPTESDAPPTAAPITAAPVSAAPVGRRIFITVAEVSGDKHAAQLVRSLKRLDHSIAVEGHGGPEMAAAGAIVHRDTVTKAAMGWRGALRAVEISNVLRWTKRHFAAHPPDLWIGVDSPSMNFHFAKTAKALGVPTLQYVAPQLWGWAQWRMWKLRAWVDHVACILPFEEAYFRGHGVNASFVGHPLFDELPPRRGAAAERAEPRFPDRPPVIGLLPGSRTSIARANFPGLVEAAARIEQAFPEASFVVPTTPATDAVAREVLDRTPRVAGFAGPTRVERRLNAFDEMVSRCDLCLTVSGTATLHVAALGVPMLVVYRGGRASWHLVGRWLFQTRTFALVNLLAATSPERADPARHLVREFIPWYGSGEPVAALAIDYLRYPERLAELRRRLNELIASLDHPGASDNVARLALAMAAHRAVRA